jgi:hypothetical protein
MWKYDGDSYFFACEDTRTVGDIRRDPHSRLAYQAKSGMLGMKTLFPDPRRRGQPDSGQERFAEHWQKSLGRLVQARDRHAGLTLIKVHAQTAALLGRL